MTDYHIPDATAASLVRASTDVVMNQYWADLKYVRTQEQVTIGVVLHPVYLNCVIIRTLIWHCIPF